LVDADDAWVTMPDNHSAALVGQTIAGKFVIETVIAVGGIGTVYRARQLGLDRKVALKLLQEEFAQDEDFIERFKREDAPPRAWTTPTRRLLDFGQLQGSLYLAMEYVEGHPLPGDPEDFPLSGASSISVADAGGGGWPRHGRGPSRPRPKHHDHPRHQRRG
jgi:serine/threonine protein kinase